MLRGLFHCLLSLFWKVTTKEDLAELLGFIIDVQCFQILQSEHREKSTRTLSLQAWDGAKSAPPSPFYKPRIQGKS